MSSRPVLLAMNNPRSSDPEKALYPHDKTAAGYRLWRMLYDYTHAPQIEYLRVFDRRNVINGPKWNHVMARARFAEVVRDLKDREVVVLGAEPRVALFLAETAVGEWRDSPHLHAPFRYTCLPHPSGRNIWYNDMAKRQNAAIVLVELYMRYTREESDGIEGVPEAGPDTVLPPAAGDGRP